MQTRVPPKKDLFPFEWYHFMRDSHPVSYDEHIDSWQVFRYEDVLRILNDYTTFSSRRRLRSRLEDDVTLPSIISMDPPRHRQLRNLVTQAFTPRIVAQLAPRITTITNELLDKVIPLGTMDIIDDLSSPLPVIVIAELLGIPSEERARFKGWSDQLIEGDLETILGPDASEYIHAHRQNLHEMKAYFLEVVEERRRHPQSDLISSLVQAEVDGQKLSEDELLGFCIILLVAGNITTTNLIGSAILCFDEHPETMDILRQNPSLMPSAIEEVLRYRSPVEFIGRTATIDTTIGDQFIQADQLILSWIGSANHDERQFPNPEQFDIQREPNRHLSFGHGIHFCIGAPLARLEAKIALNILLNRSSIMKRVPNTQLETVRSAGLFGVKHLPVIIKGG